MAEMTQGTAFLPPTEVVQKPTDAVAAVANPDIAMPGDERGMGFAIFGSPVQTSNCKLPPSRRIFQTATSKKYLIALATVSTQWDSNCNVVVHGPACGRPPSEAQAIFIMRWILLPNLDEP